MYPYNVKATISIEMVEDERFFIKIGMYNPIDIKDKIIVGVRCILNPLFCTPKGITDNTAQAAKKSDRFLLAFS